MAGELNGTNVLLYRDDNGFQELVGQLDITSSYGGSPIDISNKSTGDFVVLMDGELSTQQWTISGSIIYNSDATFQTSKQERYAGTQSKYNLDYGDNDKDIVFIGMFDSMTDTFPQGAAVQTDFSIVSTGAPTEEAFLISNDGFNLVSADGFTLTAGVPLGS